VAVMHEKLTTRATRTRSALIAAGINLLADRPIDAIPIDDVVSAAAVAKGSFFNHFVDKDGFAAAIAAEVRMEIEAWIGAANENVDNPIARLAGGMGVAVEFALKKPKRTRAMLRGTSGAMSMSHPLNQGVKADIDACVSANLLRPEAANAGVLFWLGLCTAMMINVIEQDLQHSDAASRLKEMLVLGLIGLGSDADTAAKIANQASDALIRSC
jgi:AcrR family transcriptional regulator